MKRWGVTTSVFDPWADPIEVFQHYGIELENEKVSNSFDVCIVAVGHDVYRRMTPSEFKKMCPSAHPILVDIKSLYSRHESERVGFITFRL